MFLTIAKVIEKILEKIFLKYIYMNNEVVFLLFLNFIVDF